MSNKDLIEDLNHLRIKYGSTNVYKSLMKLMRDEYEELSSFFGVSQNINSSTSFYPSNSTDFYKEYMELAAQAATDTLQEQHVPVNSHSTSSFYEDIASLDAESVNEDIYSIVPEDNAADDELFTKDIELLAQIFNDNNPYSEISTENSDEVSAATQQEPVKIIQTKIEENSSDEKPKKRLLKKKTTNEAIEVVKETPAPIKKKKSTST